jgi:hypothetical protein
MTAKPSIAKSHALLMATWNAYGKTLDAKRNGEALTQQPAGYAHRTDVRKPAGRAEQRQTEPEGRTMLPQPEKTMRSRSYFARRGTRRFDTAARKPQTGNAKEQQNNGP